MPGLLDYVKGYQDGGGVDFDPYADTTQAQLLEQLNINVDTDAMGLLPTYDSTGADLAREAYNLRSDATRGQATGSLLDLTQQTQQQQAGTGFAGAGAGQQAYRDVREDVVTGYGQVAGEQYLDLQRDIHGIQKDYERELISAVGDLPEESWRFGETYVPGTPGYGGSPESSGLQDFDTVPSGFSGAMITVGGAPPIGTMYHWDAESNSYQSGYK